MNSKKTPLYRDTAFNLQNANLTRQTFENEQHQPQKPEHYIYSRYRNPTVVATEEQLALIEDSNWALLFSSGMAALDSALSMYQLANDNRPWLFFDDIYGGTHSYIQSVLLARRNQSVVLFQTENQRYDYQKLEETIKKHKPAVIFFEIISNPMLMVADAPQIIKLAHQYHAKVIIDNTFTTPYLYKPLKHKADLIIHSATKYLAGHGNLTAGVVAGNDETLRRQLIEYRKWVGNIISPDEAFRLHDQLKTFELRYAKQLKNAYQLAYTLEVHPAVQKVYYPGLESHPTYEKATQLFGKTGFGAMINFSIDGKNNAEKTEKTNQFIAYVQNNIALLPTLGDVETTLLPVGAVWSNKFTDAGMIRLSVGIENYEHLEKTFLEALNKIK